MKKSLSLVLALMLAVGCLGVFGTASAWETWYVKTGNGGALNVRDVNTQEVIGSLPYGSQVGVQSYQGDFAVIIWGGVGDALVKAKYLVDYDPGPYKGNGGGGTTMKESALGATTVSGLNKQYESMQYVTSYTVRVNPDTKTGTARLRWAPSKNSTLVALLPSGYELTVLAANSSWLMVQDPTTNKIGYIAVKYTVK